MDKTGSSQVVAVLPDGPKDTILSALPALERSHTDRARPWQHSSPRRLQRSSSSDILNRDRVQNKSGLKRSMKRLQLPSFELLGISSLRQRQSQERDRARQSSHEARALTGVNGCRRTPSRSHTTSSSERLLEPNIGVRPLLTPPEDADSIKWNTATRKCTAESASSSLSTFESTQRSSKPSTTANSQSGEEPPGDSQSSSQAESHSQTPSQHHTLDDEMAPSGRVLGTWLSSAVSITGELVLTTNDILES